MIVNFRISLKADFHAWQKDMQVVEIFPPWKTRAVLHSPPAAAHTMVADVLVTQGARASSAMVLAYIARNFLVSAPEVLTVSVLNFLVSSPNLVNDLPSEHTWLV